MVKNRRKEKWDEELKHIKDLRNRKQELEKRMAEPESNEIESIADPDVGKEKLANLEQDSQKGLQRIGGDTPDSIKGDHQEPEQQD